MSAVAPSVSCMVHPWRLLRASEHVLLEWHDDGPMGRTNHATDTISLRRGMTWAQRRCTVLHELLHLERGPVPIADAAREEEAVRRETARRMLPDIKPVAEAIAWASCMEECADDLGVDVAVLRYRLAHLHPAERGYLRTRLDDSHGLG